MGICLGLQLFFARERRGARRARAGLLPGRGAAVPHRPAGAARGLGAGGPHRRRAAPTPCSAVFSAASRSSSITCTATTRRRSPESAVLGTGDYERRFPTHRGPRQRARRAVPSGEVAARGHRAARRVRAVAPVTTVRGRRWSIVYVLRGAGGRARVSGAPAPGAGGRCPGSWEAVHGHIEPGETPAEAAACASCGGDRPAPAAALQPEPGRVLLPAPARRGRAGAGLRRVRRARTPRCASAASTTGSSGCAPARGAAAGSPGRASGAALDDIGALLGAGRRRAVEDVLRVC